MSLPVVTVQFCVYRTNISLVLVENVTSCLYSFRVDLNERTNTQTQPRNIIC